MEEILARGFIMAQVHCDISNENIQETKKMVARHEN